MNTRKRNLIKLKIKAKNLAEEAKIIRKEENKLLNRMRSILPAYRNDDDATFNDYHDISSHRKGIVRDEARATHLARSFLSGKMLSEIENPVKWKKKYLDLLRDTYSEMRYKLIAGKVARMIVSYGSITMIDTMEYSADRKEKQNAAALVMFQAWVEESYNAMKEAA